MVGRLKLQNSGNEHFFGEIKNGTMYLNEIGQFAFENLQDIGAHYPYAEVPLFVVMPNHIHGIVFIDGEKWGNGRIIPDTVETRRASSLQQPTPQPPHETTKNEKMQKISHRQSLLSNTIGGFKSAISKFANTHNITFAWQTRFHDRIIRNQEEMNRIADYIENNPMKWEMDCFNRQNNGVSEKIK